MSGPRNTEPLANAALARALRRRNPNWNDRTVHAERTHVIQQAVPGSGTSKRPDILIDPPHRQPVIVETEFAPAHTVEQDATARLGTSLLSTGEDIEGVLSVVLPGSLKTGDLEAIEGTAFRYATHYLDSGGEGRRWPPERQWLEGGVDDLADAIEYLSLSERQLARGTEALEQVVRNAAGLLAKHAGDAALSRIARNLHQEAGAQTERMAAAICVSAFVFHVAIEEQDCIPPVPLPGFIDKGVLLAAWDAILEVNYWPVFSIARDLVKELPIKGVPPVMNRIAESISDLAQLGATTYHDLTGRMFQTLITDRKFLATFYTLPESACLLAELAVKRLATDWSDKDAIQGLRIADFACGTGALLSAAQRAIYRRFRRAGGDDKNLHRALMEHVLIGLDIMPAATHLTCSMLSSAHPSLAYGESQIHTMPYGIENGETNIGSLNFLNAEHSVSLFATGESLGGIGSEGSSDHSVTVKDNSCDLVIMNPPFTRPLGHEGVDEGVPISSFGGFSTSADEQRAMAGRLRKFRSVFGHGYAGLASNFMDLAHCKLKNGGVLALVLPFTFTQGQSWGKTRTALNSGYSDIHLLSIARTGSTESAFSADTGMAECLIVATKKSGGDGRTIFSNLGARPGFLLEAAIIANGARSRVARGNILDAGAAGVRSFDVIKAAQNLQEGHLLLPRHIQAVELPVVRLGEVANRGVYSMNIGRWIPSNAPFRIRLIREGEVPTWPALWNHKAERERKLVVGIDTCADVEDGRMSRAAAVWDQTASRLHANQDFRLNSQSLAMCLTTEPCLGGRAWPNVIPNDGRHELPLLLWCNSTLGLVMFWWRGTRQQSGRANLKITAVPSLPVLDPRSLTERQLDHCRAIFENFRGRDFLPANQAYEDETRKALDRVLLFGTASVLRLDPALEEGLDLLRKQWCAEPSVHGGKGTRIHA